MTGIKTFQTRLSIAPGADPGVFKRGEGGDFCRGGLTTHCLITKICEQGACFLYFSHSSKWRMTTH